jgi:aromatic ring hydroxylase
LDGIQLNTAVNQVGSNMAAMVNMQTSARMLSHMEFFCGLAMKLADAIGITGFLHVQERLGEMLSILEVARGVFYGMEALAREGPDGIWTITSPAGRGFHLQTIRIYRRFVEIVHLLGGGGFFYAASQADLENPEERPYIDTDLPYPFRRKTSNFRGLFEYLSYYVATINMNYNNI